jgi:hypothetical protein
MEKFSFIFTFIVIGVFEAATWIRFYRGTDWYQAEGGLIFLSQFLVLFMVIWAQIVCVISDPGYVEQDVELLSDGQDRCDKCLVSKKREDGLSVHHCSMCRRCVVMKDHHCGWVSNCVGIRTLKPFLLFTSYLVLLCGLNVWILLINFYKVNPGRSDQDGLISFADLFLHKFRFSENLFFKKPLAWVDDFLLTVALGFLIFSAFFTVITFKSVLLNETAADHHKKVQRERRSCKQSWDLIFGDLNFLFWALPIIQKGYTK